MYSKFFTRLFLLIGMIGLFSAPMRADEIQIGSGSQTDANLPTHSYFKYSLTQQIYTAEEIEDAGGAAGTINSIAFYNNGSEKTRNLDVYLVNTDKTSFSGTSDWIAVTSSDLVYSNSFTFNAGAWNTIIIPNGFVYTGDNLAIIVDDNTGNDVSGLSCYVFNATETQSHYFRRDGSDINPTNPGTGGSCVTTKNIIKLGITLANVTCAKPKNFNATGIAAHTATLTWTAGAEGQSNWDVYVTTNATVIPDENTTPTYQVTECSKALANLAAQTTYYAYVRANCGDGDKSKWASKTFTTTREALAVDAANPYSQDFETNNDWGFTNGSLTNQWCWGNATNNGGQKAMYVSNDGGNTNAYGTGATVVFASKLFNFAQGTYTIVFDWKANGEKSNYGTHYDYLRAALAPGDVDFTAGTLPSNLSYNSTPSTWIALDGGQPLDMATEWQGGQTTEATISGTYTMVFVWRNDGSGGENPPAAIDNISINLMNCPRPTALTASNITGRTATLTWTENGTATNWVLQYATNSTFTENLTETNVSGTASKDLANLSPETKYYARVKSVLGNDESLWSDVKDFTTTATCVKPTSVTANNITAYTTTISWTNGEEGQDAWEISYSTSAQSNPENGTVLPVTTNPYTLNGLTPETSYYVYVRADCGSEDGKSAWSSYKYFTTLATCVKPTGLTANNVTATTASITWTAGEAGQDTWNLQYKKSSDSEWQTVAVTTTSYNLTNLSPVTTYNVRVQADCGEGDLSQWTSNTNFTTECAALTLPYTCDFEGAVETSGHFASYPVPKCWDRIEMQYGSYPPYTYYPYVYDYSSDAHGGTKSLRMLKNSNSANETIILPEVDGQYDMSSLQIRFWAKTNSTNQTLQVGVMEGTTFVQVDEVTVANSTYAEYTVFFDGYNGTGRKIAIKCGSYQYLIYYYIDDLAVEVAPSCRLPKDLNATVDSDSQATLTWTAGKDETAWNVQYKKATDSNWSEPIAVDETTYTLTGLKRATVYEARVQAVCSTDDQSDWTNPISFTTECGIWAIDAQNSLSEDFENVGALDFPPTCWEKFSHEMSGSTYWYLNSNNGLGSSAAYSYWNEGYAFLVMPQMHINGNAVLSFDYLIGSGTYNESCSVVVSTGEMTYNDFSQTIWEADGNNLPSGKASATVSLSSFSNQDIYVAFKFKGLGTSGCTWYIDNVEVYVNTTQTTQLAQGWNWWSTYIEQDNIDGLTMLENSLGHNGSLIMTQGLNVENYYSQVGYDYWWGDLSSIQNEKGYKVKVSGACNATMTGKNVVSESHPITIQPNWNWIGYPCTMQQSINAANFQPSDGDIIVKQGDNSTYYENYGWWPEFTMEPGKSYQYHSTDTEAKTMVFSGTRGGILPKANRDNTHWTARNFKNYKAVKGIILIDGVEQFSDRYEVGAFCGDECRASVRAKLFPITNQYVVNLTIGSDLDNSGELITFRIYDHQTQQELDLESTNSLTLDDFEPMGTINNWFQYTFVTPANSFTKEITGYGNSNGGYYLIATPIDDVNPAEIDGMIATPAENYDFYWFDQTRNLEWVNYKAGAFNMVSGMGYLYANKNGVTLTFTGTPIDGPTYEVSLVKDDEAEFPGWNLVGNPFAEHTAYIDRDCYVINTNGRAEIIASDTRSIEAMEGAFVIATENDETMTFSTEAPAKGAMVTLNVSKGRSVIDRAVVRFGEGHQLPKFQLNPNHTKLYIPQGESNFAVVRSASEGEMPVSFRAESNGTYTLNFDAKNVEMNYLHLIDNLTGANVDLLVNPSYTFEAKTTDYTSRFKLMFVCGDYSDNETFAYYNGSEWVISNMGEATLQVVDMMGRVLSTETVSGNATMHINQTPGVYMLRLVNGDSVKVQKVVVR